MIDLVDSIEYTTTNCFAHQLHAALHTFAGVETVALADVQRHPRPGRVVCRLKQRTLFRSVPLLRSWMGDAPVVVFDQDPWHAFMDDSPFKGTYHKAHSSLNVVSFAVTTPCWSKRIIEQRMPSTFVRMGTLPAYCSSQPTFDSRTTEVGFVGTAHPYRRRLFDSLRSMGVDVQARGNTLSYGSYLNALSGIRVFVHSEDAPVVVDEEVVNLRDGLWVKDVEAAARGCYSIRNTGSDSEAYLDGVETVRLYDDVREIPRIIEGIMTMDAAERQSSIDRTVEFIRRSNVWHETASTLLSLVGHDARQEAQDS